MPKTGGPQWEAAPYGRPPATWQIRCQHALRGAGELTLLAGRWEGVALNLLRFSRICMHAL